MLAMVFAYVLRYNLKIMHTSLKTFCLLTITFFSWPSTSFAQGTILEDFSSYAVGQLQPSSRWRSRNGIASEVYSIQKEENNQYLQAYDTGQSVQLFRKKGWDIHKYPILSWKWRAHIFPEKANELSGNNDSVAGIYVVFPKKWFMPKSIKYVWSSSVKEETVIRRHENFPIIVIRKGKEPIGQWVTEKRDVMKDYKMLFDSKPDDPVAFGFLTDANSVKTLRKAKGDYDDIKVMKK
jgi:hypothetical protein